MRDKISFAPEDRHFNTIAELKQKLLKYKEARKFDFEKTPNPFTDNLPYHMFEKIRLKDGSFILLPIDWDYMFLYRGQTGNYGKCTPSLFRTELSDDDVFIERLKAIDLELLIRQHPIVISVFNKNRFNVDYEGLAQHYGMKTDILDLTIDIDIALFFAMCNYDAVNDKYYPQKEDKVYTGYIYSYFTLRSTWGDNEFGSLFINNLKAIGLQPFKRPGAQKGFSLKMSPQESLIANLYTFNYTKADSEKYFENAERLFPRDLLAYKAKLVLRNKVCSMMAVCIAVHRHDVDKKGIDYYSSMLMGKGYRITLNPEQTPWGWKNEEIERILYDWNTYDHHIFDKSIVSRKMFSENKWFNCVNIDSFFSHYILRSFAPGIIIEDE